MHDDSEDAGVDSENPQTEQGPLLVSACLLGLPTRYDGGHRRREKAVRALRERTLVPFCPEQLGGLPTPRPPAEIEGGSGADVLDGRARVVAADGRDVTARYLRGARTAAAMAEMFGCRRAVLKEGSPACGVGRIVREGSDVAGSGVTAALLHREGIQLDGIE